MNIFDWSAYKSYEDWCKVATLAVENENQSMSDFILSEIDSNTKSDKAIFFGCDKVQWYPLFEELSRQVRESED